MAELVSLSEEGIITDPSLIVKKLFNYYIIADKSQSTEFSDIASFKYTFLNHGNNPDNFQIQMRSDLEKLLSKYFPVDNVQVEVRIKDKGNNTYDMGVIINVRDEDGNLGILDRSIILDLLNSEDIIYNL